MSRETRQSIGVAVGLLSWVALWFGGWIAGGLLFPAYEVPAMIGAALGWVAGLASCFLCLWLGRVD